MSDNDGGHAFPTDIYGGNSDRHAVDQYPGMTLRDYFAAAALPAITAGTPVWAGKSDAVALAERAFAIADAMLKARSLQAGAQN